MAKKKKSQRKRNFAYSGSATKNQPVSQVASQANDSAGAENTAKPIASDKPKHPVTADLSTKIGYLSQDLKMIGLLALGAIVLEIALWVLLRHTNIGNHLFGL